MRPRLVTSTKSIAQHVANWSASQMYRILGYSVMASGLVTILPYLHIKSICTNILERNPKK